VYYIGYDGIDGEYELYDLARDPDELTNVYGVGLQVESELREELLHKITRVNQGDFG
jgi:hypothetical protein